MTTKKLTKLLALYLPYILRGLVATNLGEAWRLAEGKELGDKIMSMMGTVPLAFANPLPSLHPLDLLAGLCCGAGLRLAVYLRGKSAKKYRHGMEYGSARCGAYTCSNYTKVPCGTLCPTQHRINETAVLTLVSDTLRAIAE